MLVLACAAALALPAAAPAGETPPAAGELLFQRKCAACHEGGGWGTRALERRVPPDQAQLRQRPSVPAALVRYVVRHGVGSMPQFTPTDLSDAELARLAQWLETRK